MSKRSKIKRLRVFAGPNGSGKSTLANALRNPSDKRIKLGVFVNADEILQSLTNEGFVSLYKYYRFKSITKDIRKYVLEKGMSPKLLELDNVEKMFSIRKNKVYFSDSYNSYVAADIAGFIRSQLLLKGNDFSFESVFSHDSKLELLTEAKDLGYRVYFYFLTTEDPEININRVEIRVAKQGHPVPKRKIRDRYYRSLDLLLNAVKLSDRAYLFDNSGLHYEMIAEITNGDKVVITDYDKNLPEWFMKYVYLKSIKGE